MTTTTDSLLADFARSSDRHREAARKTIAPEVREPKKYRSTPTPDLASMPAGEKRKDVK